MAESRTVKLHLRVLVMVLASRPRLMGLQQDPQLLPS